MASSSVVLSWLNGMVSYALYHPLSTQKEAEIPKAAAGDKLLISKVFLLFSIKVVISDPLAGVFIPVILQVFCQAFCSSHRKGAWIKNSSDVEGRFWVGILWNGLFYLLQTLFGNNNRWCIQIQTWFLKRILHREQHIKILHRKSWLFGDERYVSSGVSI